MNKNNYDDALNQMSDTKDVNVSANGGFHDINMNLLGYKGAYYPSGTKISVKPFSTEEVIYFTSINENNPLEVDRAMHYLIEKCVQVRINDKLVKSPSEIIYNFDRFTIILLTRTYSDMRTDLSFENECSKKGCGHNQKIKVIPQNIVYTKDNLSNIFNPSEDLFIIEKKSSGAKYGYRPCSIKENQDLFNYLIDKREELSESDLKSMVKIFPFMRLHMGDAKDMDGVYHAFKDLHKDAIIDMSTLSENFDLNTKQMINTTCGSCGHVEDVALRFPNGIKSVVIDKTKIDDFIL